MKGKRNPFIAREGLLWLILVMAMFGLLLEYADPVYLIIPIVLFIWLFAIFRDPRRDILHYGTPWFVESAVGAQLRSSDTLVSRHRAMTDSMDEHSVECSTFLAV